MRLLFDPGLYVIAASTKAIRQIMGKDFFVIFWMFRTYNCMI